MSNALLGSHAGSEYPKYLTHPDYVPPDERPVNSLGMPLGPELGERNAPLLVADRREEEAAVARGYEARGRYDSEAFATARAMPEPAGKVREFPKFLVGLNRVVKDAVEEAKALGLPVPPGALSVGDAEAKAAAIITDAEAQRAAIISATEAQSAAILDETRKQAAAMVQKMIADAHERVAGIEAEAEAEAGLIDDHDELDTGRPATPAERMARSRARRKAAQGGDDHG
jgi:hypothetical protein